MKDEKEKKLTQTVLRRYGLTFGEEAGVRGAADSPPALFQLLFTALLLSARIRSTNAVQAARALVEAGLTTPQKMAAASWEERVEILTTHGYKRYDGLAASELGDTAARLVERYDGDLRKLREEAQRSVQREKILLKQFKGIGDVGADIFLREVQAVWDEVYPYADERVLAAARKLGLPDTPQALARLVPRREFARLAAALVRVELAHAHEAVRTAAAA